MTPTSEWKTIQPFGHRLSSYVGFIKPGYGPLSITVTCQRWYLLEGNCINRTFAPESNCLRSIHTSTWSILSKTYCNHTDCTLWIKCSYLLSEVVSSGSELTSTSNLLLNPTAVSQSTLPHEPHWTKSITTTKIVRYRSSATASCQRVASFGSELHTEYVGRNLL